MSADLDADVARKALALRLRDWGVADPAPKARAFIDDLQSRGWKCKLDEPRRKPPRREDECPDHPGEYAYPICRGHAADKRAKRDAADAEQANHRRQTATDALAAARATLAAAKAAGCKHGPVVCSECRRARDTESTQPEGASA